MNTLCGKINDVRSFLMTDKFLYLMNSKINDVRLFLVTDRDKFVYLMKNNHRDESYYSELVELATDGLYTETILESSSNATDNMQDKSWLV